LIDRAESADRSFRARDADPAQLAALCRRTDGIPLAIELAATWLPSIGVDEVIDLAGDPAPGAFGGLDSHHRSLRHAVDWSFGLLTESDQRLVAAASVFRGSFVLDAFRAVCAPDATASESAGTVSRLVESSLLVPERRDGGLRYRMLEPVREYGAARLEEIGEAAAVAVRHARWLLRRAIELGEVIGRETDPARAQQHIDAELADYRAAMQFFLDAGDHESAASLATRLTGYWFARYLGWEAIRWLDAALEGAMSDVVRVQATWTAGWAAYSRADYAAATTRYEESRALAEGIGERGAVGRAVFGQGRIELPRDPAKGRALVREALAVFTEAGMERERGDCLLALGFTAARQGEVAEAEALLGEGLEIMERCGSLRSRAIGHRYLSMAAWHSEERDKAFEHADEAERLARLADDRPAIGGALIQRALVEARWGSTAVAAAAVIEALGQLPTRHEIDHCLVFFGALDVLFSTGHGELAARVLDHVDRVFSEHGWVSVDVRMPVVARWRAMAADTEVEDLPAVSSADLAKVLRSILSEIADAQ
jgi:tetratricopeptide (TPR) repeat protein